MEIKKIAMATGMSAMLVVGMGSAAFATPLSNSNGANSTTTPITATIQPTQYDFSVTEVIQMSASANDNDAIVNAFTLTNNSNTGCIKETLNLSNANGWTAKSFDTEWSSESVGSKSYGLKADSSVDMLSTVDGTGYEASESIVPAGTNETKFTGKVPAQSQLISAVNVGDIIATVEWV